MSYVLQRNEDGALVSRPGLPSSYTRSLQQAQVFSTPEEAQRNACGNESVRNLYEMIVAPHVWR